MAYVPGIQKISDNFPVPNVRIGQQGEILMSDLHADYYEQTVRGNKFFSHSVARATSLVTTAMVGHILWNPPDSGVNMVLCRWSSMVHVTSATTVGIVLAAGYSASAPTGTTVSDNSGSGYIQLQGAALNVLRKGKVQAYASCTVLTAPIPVWLLHHNTAAIATTGEDNQLGDFAGSFVFPPGYFACLAAQGVAVAAAGHTSSLTWEEVPTL